MKRWAIVPCLIVSHAAAWLHMPLSMCGALVIVGFGLLAVLRKPSAVPTMPPAPPALRIRERRHYRGRVDAA